MNPSRHFTKVRRGACRTLPGALAVTAALAASPASATSSPDETVFCANHAGYVRIVSDARHCLFFERVHRITSGSGTDLTALETRVEDLEKAAADFAGRFAALETRLGGIDGSIAGLDTRIEDGLAGLQAELDLLEAEALRLDALLAGLDASVGDLADTFAGVERNGATLRFSGVNLQLVNGTDATHTSNGMGNLILGYDEPDGRLVDRDGSHNLVIGEGHDYRGTAGIVAGARNTIDGNNTAILGGFDNFNQGRGSVIVTGRENTIDSCPDATPSMPCAILNGRYSEASEGGVVVSGHSNVARGGGVVVSGALNEADELLSVVVSGQANEAYGGVIVSGYNNVMSGEGFAVIVGGNDNFVEEDVLPTSPYSTVLINGDGTTIERTQPGPPSVWMFDHEFRRFSARISGDLEVIGGVTADFISFP